MPSSFAFNGSGELLLLQSTPATLEQQAWLYSVKDTAHIRGGYVITSSMPCPVDGYESTYNLGVWETNIATVDVTVKPSRDAYIRVKGAKGTHRIHKTDGSYVNVIHLVIEEGAYKFEDVDNKGPGELPIDSVTHITWFPLSKE